MCVAQNDGCLNFVDENDEVLISGFGRRGKAKGDIPGVRFKVVKVSGVGLLALWKEKKVRSPSSLWSGQSPDSLTATLSVYLYRRSPDHNFAAPPFSPFYSTSRPILLLYHVIMPVPYYASPAPQ